MKTTTKLDRKFNSEDWALFSLITLFILAFVALVAPTVSATTFSSEEVTVKSYKVDQYSDLNQAIQAGSFYFVGPYVREQYEKSQTIEIEEVASEIQLLDFTTAKMMTYEIRDELLKLDRGLPNFDRMLQEIKEQGFLNMEDVVQFMEQNNYRPATKLELMALAIKYPEVHEDRVIALGTNWYHEDNGRTSTVQLIANHEGGRNVLARTIDSGWMEGTLFAAVRISQ